MTRRLTIALVAMLAAAAPASGFRVTCRDGERGAYRDRGKDATGRLAIYRTYCEIDEVCDGVCTASVVERTGCVECDPRPQPVWLTVALNGRRSVREVFTPDGVRVVVKCRRARRDCR